MQASTLAGDVRMKAQETSEHLQKQAMLQARNPVVDERSNP
jgi:hypothetical protein